MLHIYLETKCFNNIFDNINIYILLPLSVYKFNMTAIDVKINSNVIISVRAREFSKRARRRGC